jgi:hypothetical protein
MATSQSGSTDSTERRPTYRDVTGETVHGKELSEGDMFVARVSWFGSFDECIARPTHFRVTRADDMLGDVIAEGSDGNTYKFYGDRAHVECLTDDDQGYHRGNKAARLKRI